MPYKVQQAVQRHCGDRVTTLSSGGQMAVLPDSCALDLDPATVTSSVARIEAADFGEDLTRHIADIDQKLTGFDRYGRLARERRIILEAQGRK